MKTIKVLILDVDGTLTDGKIHISNNGELFKSFNVKDGLMIKQLRTYNIHPVVITGRKSEITYIRCKELAIDEIHQGIHNKLNVIDKILKKFCCTYEEIAYIGDDINDIDGMKKCKLIGCPHDAACEVKKIAHFISNFDGGKGAVREFIDYIIKVNKG